MLCWISSKTHRETCSHNQKRTDDERAPPARLIRTVGNEHGKDCGGDVDRNSHELCLTALVAQLPDDGWKEQADAVYRANNLQNAASASTSRGRRGHLVNLPPRRP